MELHELKAKLPENKLAVISAVVALCAGLTAYFRADALTEVEHTREAADARLQILRFNEVHGAKSLAQDLQTMEELYRLAETRALDFDSNIAAQAFFSELILAPDLKIEGIPTLNGLPIPNVKPFAHGAYLIQGTGPVSGFINLAKRCEEQQVKCLRIDRVQFSSGESPTSTGTAGAVGTIALRAWGLKQDGTKITAPTVAPTTEKISLTRDQRKAKLVAAQEAFNKRVDIAGTRHLFGPAGAAGGADSETSNSALEAALKTLKISPTVIFGQRAIRSDKLGVKRVGNSFEITVDGTTHKVILKEVTAESATFFVSGKMIKIPING